MVRLSLLNLLVLGATLPCMHGPQPPWAWTSIMCVRLSHGTEMFCVLRKWETATVTSPLQPCSLGGSSPVKTWTRLFWSWNWLLVLPSCFCRSQAGLLTRWSSPLRVGSGQLWEHSSTPCWLYGDSSAPSCLQPRLLLVHPEAPPTSPTLTPTQHQPPTKQRENLSLSTLGRSDLRTSRKMVKSADSGLRRTARTTTTPGTGTPPSRCSALLVWLFQSGEFKNAAYRADPFVLSFSYCVPGLRPCPPAWVD